jgi:hypothetical protein
MEEAAGRTIRTTPQSSLLILLCTNSPKWGHDDRHRHSPIDSTATPRWQCWHLAIEFLRKWCAAISLPERARCSEVRLIDGRAPRANFEFLGGVVPRNSKNAHFVPSTPASTRRY